MFEIKKPTKGLQDLVGKLGSEYSIKLIDLEQCIYRKINDSYDIEVSGLNNNRKNMNATIYVWQLQPGRYTVETISDIKSFEHLKYALTDTVEKYRSLNQ